MEFDALFAKRATHIKPGLERIARSFNFLQRPASNIPAALIGGTNGKGSTSGFLWSLLRQNKGEFALYTSPHLVEFSERFQLALQACDDHEVAERVRHLQKQLPAELYEELSFFEAATLIAFQIFEARQARFQVLEVGLGGRWDATNISDPLVAVLVSVSRDHEEYLGQDLEKILLEKLGIMRPGRPLFWGNSGEVCALAHAQELIVAQARALHSPLYRAREHFWLEGADATLRLQLPDLPALSLPLSGFWASMPGFLQNNLALAAAVYHYLSIARPELSLLPLKHIWKDWLCGGGSSPVTLMGRSQRLLAPQERGAQRLLIDVCHNPDGARNFVAAVQQRQLPRPMPALVCVLRDKDYDGILDILRSEFHPVILFGIDHPRAWKPTVLAARHQDLDFYPNLAEAWSALESLMKAEGGAMAAKPWVLCGSVLAVGQVLQWLAVSPKEVNLARVIGGDWPWTAP